jgi:hypothetical protein
VVSFNQQLRLISGFVTNKKQQATSELDLSAMQSKKQRED